jgi:hypothetical protein
MRRKTPMRVFIFDLEGDQRGTRITDNVFCITIPVCVGSMVLATIAGPNGAATSSYKRDHRHPRGEAEGRRHVSEVRRRRVERRAERLA